MIPVRASTILPITTPTTPPPERGYTIGCTEELDGIPPRLTAHEEAMVNTRKRAAREHDIDPELLPIDETQRSTLRFNLDYQVSSQRGKRPALEDAHLVMETKYGPFLGIADGHGPCDSGKLLMNKPQLGLQFAQMALASIRDNLLRLIEENNFDMKSAFEKCAEIAHENLPKAWAGTVLGACIVEKVNGILNVFNIGHIRVVVFRKVDGLIFPIPMTLLDDWSNEEAFERVRKILPPDEFEMWSQQITRLMIEKAKQTMLPADYKEWRENHTEYRRFPPIIGLIPTNSLGDKKMIWDDGQTAITHNPTCSQLQLMEDDIIVVGCDGLWDTNGLTIDGFMSDVLQPHWDNPDFDLAKCATEYALTKGSSDNVTVLSARVTPWAPTLKTQKTEPLSPSLFKKV